VDVVAAAIARDKLRKELLSRLSKLTSKEAQFLKNVVDDEDVTVDQLLKADHVLRTDILYRLDHEDESDDESDDDIVNHNWKFTVSIEIEHNEIEAVVDSGFDGYGKQSESAETTKPDEYSYRTWELIDDCIDPILGMTDDIPKSSRVLSPPLIDSLRNFLPFSLSEDHFWLKYSLARDGANLQSLYHCVRQSPETILAIETANGEIFGAF